MSDQNKPVVNPVKNRYSPNVGPFAVMVSTEGDFYKLSRSLNIQESDLSPLFIGKYYSDELRGFSITGPIISAPYAVMVLENLIAWGAREIFFLGWCGSICPDVKIGDIILPSGAFIDEGTSLHYNAHTGDIAKPEALLSEKVKNSLKDKQILCHQAPIWTTDAIFRETPSKIQHFRKKGAIGVEMELSALFTVGAFRKVQVTPILIVSDELATLKWRPGFKDKKFKQARKTVCELIADLCIP